MSWRQQPPPQQYGAAYGRGQVPFGTTPGPLPASGYADQRPPMFGAPRPGQPGYGQPGMFQGPQSLPASGYAPPPARYGTPQTAPGYPMNQPYGQQFGPQQPVGLPASGLYQQGAAPGQQQPYGAAVGAFGNQPPPPPPGITQELWGWFQAVDTDKSGKITAVELRQALTNNNWSHFNPETCRLMIGMFDKDRSGTIDVKEFQALWKYVQDWKSCFDRFDTDRSGNIDSRELNTAFQNFGYNLSAQFCDMVIRVFDQRGARNINFDDFIQACVMLKTLTDKFRAKDAQQNGTVRISYEEFLEMALDNTLMDVK